MTTPARTVHSEEPIAGPFDPDLILPIQFFDRAGAPSIDSGEKQLMLAVLEEAVATFQRHIDDETRRGQRLFREAAEWTQSVDTSWAFAFENICHAIDVDPEYLRRGLESWKERRRGSAGGARVYRFPFRRVGGRRTSISHPTPHMRQSA